MEQKINLTKMMGKLRFNDSKEMPKGRRNINQNVFKELDIEVL